MSQIEGVLIFLLGGLFIALLRQRYQFLSKIKKGELWLKSQRNLGEPLDVLTFPPLIQNYLNLVIKKKSQSPWLKIHQEGVMILSPNSSEIPFKASQLMAIDLPGFSWIAQVKITPFFSVFVSDQLVSGKGELEARIMGIFPIAKLSGKEALKGQLMRFMAEIPWSPMIILYQPDFLWRQISDNEVELTAQINGVEAQIIFEFDSLGLICKTKAKDRPREVKGITIPTPWEGEFSDYQEQEGLVLPTLGKVSWIIDSQPFTYWRASILIEGNH